jgi:hypothetical protein
MVTPRPSSGTPSRRPRRRRKDHGMTGLDLIKSPRGDLSFWHCSCCLSLIRSMLQ